ncbi:MAG: hypothetical protein OJF47_001596 [Nitrospira sp.]|nr:MAG: hypothetical protein OJF47_001596 [Nitrospira sp.]
MVTDGSSLESGLVITHQETCAARLAIRLDPTVLRWLKSVATKRQIPYQSLINDLLTSEMKKVG